MELTIRTVQLATSDSGWRDGQPDLLRVLLTGRESLKVKVGVVDKVFQLCGTESYTQAATLGAGIARTVIGISPPVSHLRQLSLLGYELLGGRLDTVGVSGRGPPIAALTEAGNRVLRRGINGEFSSATEMAVALYRCVKEMGNPPDKELHRAGGAPPCISPSARSRSSASALSLLLRS